MVAVAVLVLPIPGEHAQPRPIFWPASVPLVPLLLRGKAGTQPEMVPPRPPGNGFRSSSILGPSFLQDTLRVEVRL